MNKKIWTTAACMMFASGAAMAQGSIQYATVIESRPVYQMVEVSTPREECWNEQVAVREKSSSSRTPVVLSTIVGGAIGNALGNNKSNQRVGAVVGGVLGHSIGRDIVSANRKPDRVHYETVRHCETVQQYHQEERLQGYQVRYRYNGEEYSIRTNHDPGDRIRVRVHVEPVL